MPTLSTYARGSATVGAMPLSEERDRLLRHLVATIAYRANVALEGFPRGAADHTSAAGARTPLELLAHLADLAHAAAAMAAGQERAKPQADASWESAEARFFDGLEALDRVLVSGVSPSANPDALLQGPLADALTHVGQLLLMRRFAGVPATSSGYATAPIRIGAIRRDERAPD